jgi:hypothetical protein
MVSHPEDHNLNLIKVKIWNTWPKVPSRSCFPKTAYVTEPGKAGKAGS